MSQKTYHEHKLLVDLLSKAHINHQQMFSHLDFRGKKTKMTKLFEMIRYHNFKGIDELKTKFCTQERQGNQAFRKMWHGFKEKLSNTLFFVDTNSPIFSERTKAYYMSAKRAMASRMLNERGAQNMAIELAENTLSISLKYEFNDINMMLVNFLMQRYSSRSNYKKIKYYLTLFNKLQPIYSKELEMSYESAKLSSSINIKSTSKVRIHTKNLESVTKKCIEYLEDAPSIELIATCSLIIIQYYTSIGDFDKCKYWSKFTLDLILGKPFLSVLLLERNIDNILRTTLLDKDYERALEVEKLYSDKLIPGNYNWLVIYYYFILTMLHSKQYQIAYDRWEKIMNASYLKNQSQVIAEVYHILHAYFYFLRQTRWIEVRQNFPELRIHKFLNEVPEFSKDKRGSNISIIIAQILFLLISDKHGKIIDKMDSLKLYSFRHLRKDENFRSQCFIQMLQEMIKADFKKKGTMFRSDKWLNKLNQVNIEKYPQSAENEVIPYEDLWEMILEQLD